jgi:alkylation response protein AidB-like acyl-CoA dehydrogenase
MTLTLEQQEIRALAREFAANEIAPHAEHWDAARAIPTELFEKLADLGFLGMLIPEAYGGLALDVPTYLLVLEELARVDASVALAVGIHNGPVPGILLAHGTEEQKQAWLPRIASGELLAAFALGEAESAGDAAAATCSAARDGENWVVDGTKAWVTNGLRGGVVAVFATTDADGSLGCFMIEPSHPAYSVTRRITTMGHRASETVDIRLDRVLLGPNALVGEVDRGRAYAQESLVLARTAMAAQALGIAQASLDHAIRYSLEREQFGRQLADFDATQAKLANMAARIAASRASIMDLGERVQAVKEGALETGSGADSLAVLAAGAKLVASETAMYASDEAVQIFGGYGYMRDYPVERLMRNAKGTEIIEGTSESMRALIAREIIRAGGES